MKKGVYRLFKLLNISYKIKMPNWTEEQKQAIYEKNSNLLVAAAARKW